MSFFFDFLVWLGINIFVPAILPILVLMLPRIPKKTRKYSKGLVRKAVQDGQLFWVAVALCAVGCYEFYTYLSKGSSTGARIFSIACIIALVAILCVSIVLVLMQALDIPEAGSEEGAEHEMTAEEKADSLVTTSIGFLVAATIISSVGHYFAANAEESAILGNEQRIERLTHCLQKNIAYGKCRVEGV